MNKPSKNMFRQLAKQCPFPCDICGEPMEPIPGNELEPDRIVCTSRDMGNVCGAEIVFPTSTSRKGWFYVERDEQ
jgi:hypothetical protein